MKDFYPKVSIVIPVYNGSKYLGEAIDSALAQTYKNLEIIVSNDGSNDGGATERVAKSYGDKIIYLGKKENGGAPTALNAAIKVMTGEYFSWLSHDDLYYPNKIKRQIEELAKLKDKNTILMSDLDGINEKREKIYQTHYIDHIKEYPLREKSPIHPVVYNQTHGCTLLIPKACFDEVGLFDPKERVAHDFEYFYRIFLKFPHKLIPETLVTARDTSNRMGRRAKPRADTEYSRLYIDILENLSDEDIKLLAKDKLALLSDMWNFFKAAGYTVGYDYASKTIVGYAETFCSNHLLEYLNGKSNKAILLESLARLEQLLGQVFDDNEKALKRVDAIIRDFRYRSEKILAKDINKTILLQDILQKNGNKQAAAYLLQLIVTVLAEGKKTDDLNRIIANKLVGKKELLQNNDIKEIMVKNEKKKTRVIFCSTHWLTGGMERVMANVFAQIKDDLEIYLVTPYDGRGAAIQSPKGVKHIKIANSMFYSGYEDAVLSIALILHADVLVGFYNLFEKQLNLYGLCKDAGVKTIASNHENFFYPYLNYELQEAALKRLGVYKSDVDAALWPTNFSAAVCGLGCQNSYLMPNPNSFNVVDTESIQEGKTIICVGRFDDYIKRIDRILECFKLVQDKLPESKLMVVGDCDRQKKHEYFGSKSVDDMIFELGLDENNIEFTGKVSNMDDHYKRASVLVLASNSEGFGMVINEAACFGVPSVCNKTPDIEDLVVNGENGFLTEQGDIESMADRVADILSDSKLRKRLSDNARKIVAKFDAAEIGDKWKYLIKTLTANEPDDMKKTKLKKRLSYRVADYQDFSKVVFGELNNIAAQDLEERTLLTGQGYVKKNPGVMHVAKYSLIRLSRSVKTKGVAKTGELLAKKVYQKLR